MAEKMPSDWAIERALQVMRCRASVVDVKERRTLLWSHVLGVAEYIAEREEPPVDPLVEEAQAIADLHKINLSAMPRAEAALLAALRRGLELAATSAGGEER